MAAKTFTIPGTDLKIRTASARRYVVVRYVDKPYSYTSRNGGVYNCAAFAAIIKRSDNLDTARDTMRREAGGRAGVLVCDTTTGEWIDR